MIISISDLHGEVIEQGQGGRLDGDKLRRGSKAIQVDAPERSARTRDGPIGAGRIVVKLFGHRAVVRLMEADQEANSLFGFGKQANG